MRRNVPAGLKGSCRRVVTAVSTSLWREQMNDLLVIVPPSLQVQLARPGTGHLFQGENQPMRINLIGLRLLATFIVILGSILSMALFTSQEGPSAVSVEAVAKTPT